MPTLYTSQACGKLKTQIREQIHSEVHRAPPRVHSVEEGSVALQLLLLPEP